MKLILLCTAVVLLMSAVELARLRSRKRNTIAQIYRAADITPVPETILGVYFENVTVTLGMVLPAAEAKYLPTIEFDAEEGCHYTLLGTSPDYPSRNDSSLKYSLLTIHVNLRGCSNGEIEMSDDSEIATWIGPIPAPGSGQRRFLLNVYKQNGIIDTNDKELQSYQYQTVLFDPSYFVSKYDLVSTPVSGCYWISEYPDACDVTQSDLKNFPSTY